MARSWEKSEVLSWVDMRQKIIKLEYDFPEKFFPKARDLVEKLLVLDATKRLGCEEMEGYGPLKAHPFFESITWENLHHQTPPKLTAYLPAMSEDDEDCYGNYDNLLSQFGCMQVSSSSSSHSLSAADAGLPQRVGSNIEQYIHDLDTNSFELDLQFSEDEKRLLLEKQASGNPWLGRVQSTSEKHCCRHGGGYSEGPCAPPGAFSEALGSLGPSACGSGQGRVTGGRHGVQSEPSFGLSRFGPPVVLLSREKLGECGAGFGLVINSWEPDYCSIQRVLLISGPVVAVRPNRTYYLMDPSGNAHKWCKKIQEVWRHRYQSHPDAAVQ
ncbi:hypothetical protein J1605_006052 [Eschrichtius robustus]|uniref:PDK1-type PH domain-containing protein n=1 Tax=Eschrichtius robustus TaxID=9764 RepID=A0AB34H429_ESCRO|nr:hypothetical protein J1605_006052 [Eschrichtius robustus]